MRRLAKANIAKCLGEADGRSQWALADTVADDAIQIQKRLCNGAPALQPRDGIALTEMHAFELHYLLEQRRWTCFTSPPRGRKCKKRKEAMEVVIDALGKLPTPTDYIQGGDLFWWTKHNDTRFHRLYLMALLMAESGKISEPIPHFALQSVYSKLIFGEEANQRRKRAAFDFSRTGLTSKKKQKRRRQDLIEAQPELDEPGASDSELEDKASGSASGQSNNSGSASGQSNNGSGGSESSSNSAVDSGSNNGNSNSNSNSSSSDSDSDSGDLPPPSAATSRGGCEVQLTDRNDHGMKKNLHIGSDGNAKGCTLWCGNPQHGKSCPRRRNYNKHGGADNVDRLLMWWYLQGFRAEVPDRSVHMFGVEELARIYY